MAAQVVFDLPDLQFPSSTRAAEKAPWMAFRPRMSNRAAFWLRDFKSNGGTELPAYVIITTLHICN
jgi:hypothetical protein